MDRITLHDFVKTNNGDLGEAFVQVMDVLEAFAKDIQHQVQRNGLLNQEGESGGTNVYGESVQKLDAYANEKLTNALLASPAIHSVGSEELADPKMSGNGTGIYTLTHDPVDGSSNIDTNLPIGTIFGLYPKGDTILQKGSTIVASGYILYSASMMLFYAAGGKVNGFTFDPDRQTFVLTYENVRIGEKKYYAINEGNWELFHDSEKNYVTALKKEGGYSTRYVGSMVGDIHRTLLKGGIFIYPADNKHTNGKLRLLYEVAPLSSLIIQAGGDATSNGTNPLDLVPEKHDQRVPIAVGSKSEIEKYKSFLTSS
jgi:fructose-1,6-bisphosphatase I